MNLIGGWLVMWMIIQAFPKLHPTVIESAHHFLDPPLGVRTMCLALLGGAAITLMTRMQAPSRSEVSAIAASIVGAYLLSALSLFHSVLDSLIIFGAIHAGAERIGYVDWLAWVWWVAPLNVIGGLLLVTAPRLIRSSQLAPSS
jgi:formate/nitrite transporter FocA (FNT family)